MQSKIFLVSTVAMLLSLNTFAQSQASGTINGHEYVDLGLSVKWATCNIGAENPEDYGDYFAWGEAETKSEYTQENSTTYGKDNYTFHDTAAEIWGDTWRMPTLDELTELFSGCAWEYTTIGDHKIVKLTSENNGNFIYLPIAGQYNGAEFNDGRAQYWTSSVSDGQNQKAIDVEFEYEGTLFTSGLPDRFIGKSIRPVSDGKTTNAITEIKTIDGYGFVDLGLSVKWATCDLGAYRPQSDVSRYFYWGDTVGEPDIYSNAIDKEYSRFVIDYSGSKQYDAATVNWGSNWRMPKAGELHELFDNCEIEEIVQDGRNGYRFTSKKNGNSIFLPMEIVDGSENSSAYWTSSTYEGNGFGNGAIAFYVNFLGNDRYEIIDVIDSWRGASIRPVTNATGKKLGHEYVDLGLSVKWATCNIGAEKPEDYGDRFAWGETQTKSEFTEENSKCYKTEIVENNKLHTLDKWRDAAYCTRGASWRMPTTAEWQELEENCDLEVVKFSFNHFFIKLTSRKNGNSILLSAANAPDTYPWDGKYVCEYWSSSNDSNDGSQAKCFILNCEVGDDGVKSGIVGCESISRYLYKRIRPVAE